MTETEQLIKGIEFLRKESNRVRGLIKNAEFRLNLIPGDETWTKIKKENEAQLAVITENLKNLYQKLFALKATLGASVWQSTLVSLGTVIASTENINHVANSLGDERDLNEAIDDTENAIVTVQQSLVNADEDMQIILGAQLEYYKNDMRQHFWGEERLAKLITEDTPGR